MPLDKEQLFTEHLRRALAALETSGGQRPVVEILQEILAKSRPGQAGGLAHQINDTIDTIHRQAASLRQSPEARESWLSTSLREINKATLAPEEAFQGIERHRISLRLVESVRVLSAQFLSETPPEGQVLGTSLIVLEFLNSEPGATIEAEVSKLATLAAITSGLVSDEPEAVQGAAVAIDLGLTAVKAAYQVAAGTSTISGAIETIADRTLSAVVALSEQACIAGGAQLGAALGQAIAIMANPAMANVGRIAGSVVGRFAGQMAGKVVFPMIQAGFEKIAPVAREIASKARESASSIARIVTEGAKGVRRWVTDLLMT